MELERWNPVLGWESLYAVSDLGRVRILVERNRGPRTLILAQTPDKDGYLMVRLNRTEHRKKWPAHKTRRVAQLVFEAFNGPVPEGLQLDHVNGDKIDNRLANLEAVTCAVNNQRAVARGGRLGERNGSAKLTAATVLKIRTRAAAGERFDQIARDVGVSGVQVANVAYGKVWRHAPGPLVEPRGRIGRPPQ